MRATAFTRRIASAMLLSGSIGSGALAGPPYSVDDPGTVDYHRLFLYTAYIRSWQGGTVSDTFPQLALAYGLQPNLELSAGIAGFTSNVPASLPLAPLADPALAVKWRFQEETRRSPALAAGYQPTLITVDTGLGSGFITHSLWLTASHAAGRGLLWGNVGVTLYPRPTLDPSVYYGLAWDYPHSKRLRVGVQVYGNTAARPAGIDRDLAWGIGATDAVSPTATLLLQVGRSLRGHSDLNLYAGLLVRLSR
jgi:hypothetical protein